MKKQSIGEDSRRSFIPKSPQRKFISFFSGALGLDQGLEAAGLNCLAVNDVDRVAGETIRRNKPHLKLYECDVREITFDGIRKDLGIEPGELFAIVGGPPCQAFSTAGRRLGLNDDRGNVFLHFIDLIKHLRPKYAIFENVRGLLSVPLTHRPHDQRERGYKPSQEEKPGGALLYILEKLEKAGYATTFTLYNTANFGVPQIRERLIFFASRDNREVPYMRPTHNESGSMGLSKWRTLYDAIGSLQGKPMHAAKFPENRMKYYKMLRSGQNWRNLPNAVQKEAMGNSWFAGGGKTGFYRRLAWDKPAPTLVTRPTMKATDLCHPDELRPLSVEEYAAIQTFPSDFKFEGNLDSQYRQIGNAVPCVFGEAIGRHIIEFDEGKSQKEVAPTKLSRYVGTDHESWRESIGALERQLSLLAD
ncbi:MAG TPA: DNA cytosine methyltransferase [Candidatus Angelobacter sp.]|jgi:DNA (cytosine-5)-methyltransferase 1